MAKCPACNGSGMTGGGIGKDTEMAVKNATAPGSKLKALARKRPDTIKGGMTRGGKYAKN